MHSLSRFGDTRAASTRADAVQLSARESATGRKSTLKNPGGAVSISKRGLVESSKSFSILRNGNPKSFSTGGRDHECRSCESRTFTDPSHACRLRISDCDHDQLRSSLRESTRDKSQSGKYRNAVSGRRLQSESHQQNGDGRLSSKSGSETALPAQDSWRCRHARIHRPNG